MKKNTVNKKKDGLLSKGERLFNKGRILKYLSSAANRRSWVALQGAVIEDWKEDIKKTKDKSCIASIKKEIAEKESNIRQQETWALEEEWLAMEYKKNPCLDRDLIVEV